MPFEFPEIPESNFLSLTGDVEADAFSGETRIVAVGLDVLPEIAGLTVLGNPTDATGPTIEVTASGALQYLRVNSAGDALEWGTISIPPGGSAHLIRQNGVDQTQRDALNFLDSNSIIVSINDDAGNNETEVIYARAALTGDIEATQNSNTTAFRAFSAKSVLANATNASAVPLELAGSGAFEYLRVNSTNTALEWEAIQVSSPITISSGIIGFDLSAIDSTSVVINSGTLERAALTGDVTAAQDSNTTAFRTFSAKSVLANATNGSAVPTELAGSSAFQYLRVNSANTALEWAVLSVSSPITLTGATIGFDSTATLDNNARVVVRKNSGANVGTRRRLNFIEGTGITLTVADDAGNEEVDITIDASGASGDIVWTMAALSGAASAAANAAAIQTLISGGTTHIQLPAGTFSIDSIDMASNVYMRGMGMDQTILFWANRTISTAPGSQGPINIHGTSPAHISRVVLEDFTVDGNKAGVTISGSGVSLDVECISSTFADDCVFNRVRAINAEGDGFDYDDCTGCYTIDCEAEDCDGFGLHNSLRTTRNTHLYFTAISCGVVHSRGGLDTHGTAPNEATECTFIGCRAFSCYRGFLLGGHRNILKGSRADSSTNTGIRILGNDNTVTGCISEATVGNNITIDGGDRNTISATIARDASSSGTGIIVLTGSSNNTITGCQAHSNAGSGIQVNSGASTTLCIANQTTGNSVSNFSDAGSNTTRIDASEGWFISGSAGTTGQVLTSNGSSSSPTWSSSGGGHVIRDNGSAETQRAALNFVSSTSVTAVCTDDAGNGETEATFQRAALSGAIVASANANATVFAGIRANGSATTDRTNINFISGSGVTVTATDDAGNDEIELTFSATAASVTPTTVAVFGTPTNTGVPFIIYVSFAASTPGTADDVTVFSGTAPFNFRILESWLVTSTAIVSSTVQAKTATGGLGSDLSTAMSSTVAGKTSDNSTATSTVASGGSMFLRRSDRGVAGEFFAMCVRT